MIKGVCAGTPIAGKCRPQNVKHRYDAHYMTTNDPPAKKVLADIRDEEKAHVGELMTLMRYLDPAESGFFLDGEGEVKEMLEELGLAGRAGIRLSPHQPGGYGRYSKVPAVLYYCHTADFP